MIRQQETQEEAYTFSGRDLVPLPHESSESVTARFGWMNATSMLEAYRILDTLRRWDARYSFINDSAGRDTVPRELMGRTLRQCAICMEECYHSLWFNLEGLRSCPVHGVALVDYCMSCGERLPEWRSSAQLRFGGRWPFRCSECRGWLAGAAPSLALHLDRRCQAARDEDAFRDLASWVKGYNRHPLYLDRLQRHSLGRRFTEERRAAIGQFHPWPLGCAQPIAMPPCWYAWTAKSLASNLRSRGRLDPEKAFVQRSYRALVRRVETNLAARGIPIVHPAALKVRIECDWRSEKTSDMDAWKSQGHIYALALALMRRTFETDCTWAFRSTTMASVGPYVLEKLCYENTAMSAWRTLMHAIYACAVRAIVHARDRDSSSQTWALPSVWCTLEVLTITDRSGQRAQIIAAPCDARWPFADRFSVSQGKRVPHVLAMFTTTGSSLHRSPAADGWRRLFGNYNW